MSEIRTRFAPSPTGYLHIGGARTAIYSYLLAKKYHGRFILRIEDTDLERSTKEAVEAILEGMRWLELDYDEGPFYQTERFPRYHEVLQQLLETGHAYRCYCTKGRLDALRQHQIDNKLKPRYDGLCRNQASSHANLPYVIRFKNPIEGEVIVADQVHGDVKFLNAELDDLIIARTDGSPTYNFTVVVDDYDMKITHVIRGDDHLNNTPRQINLLKALNAPLPVYAHVPMILGEDGKKLSKRLGAMSVMLYRDEGYLPQALINYLVRLGWSHGDQEIFSKEELIDFFDINKLNHSAAALNPEKLKWLNQHYIKNLPTSTIKHHLSWHLEDQKIVLSSEPLIEDVIDALRERTKTLAEMAAYCRQFYAEYISYSDEIIKKNIKKEILPILNKVKERLSILSTWNKENIHHSIEEIASENNLKLGNIGQPLRIALTGETISPPIDVTATLIGKKNIIVRIERFLHRAEEIL